MTILRTDKIAGLESVNAITGSVKFASDAGAGQGSYLEVEDPNGDIKFGTSDWTIEFWMYAHTIDTSEQENDLASILDYGYGIGSGGSATGAWFAVHQEDATLHLGFNNANQVQSSNFLTANTWHHIAIARTSNTAKIYGDGTQVATVSCSQDFTDATVRFLDIGSQPATGTERNFDGYISNLRILKGKALYGGAFTPPTRQLEVTPETILLCCQSSQDIYKEETGKTIRNGLVSKVSGVLSSTFVPDVGNDHTHGTVLEGNIEFPSLNYMTLPRGTTTQSNRGRGIFMMTIDSGNWSNLISYIQIQSMGNALDFGDLIYPRRYAAGASSATRGVVGAGIGPSWPSNKTTEYSTLATTGNALSFGELSDERYGHSAVANSTRVVWGGGYAPAPVGNNVNTIEYVTTASTGDAQDFGDLSDGSSWLRRYIGQGISNGTRGVLAGGYSGSSWSNDIVYIPNLASLSDSSNFGSLSGYRGGISACSDSTRGVFFGGYYPTNLNTIDYITIATTGDATDFGDLTTTAAYAAAVSNSIRGVTTVGGVTTNVMNHVTIQTTGNAQDFGDLNTAGGTYGANSTYSDSHGGLSE